MLLEKIGLAAMHEQAAEECDELCSAALEYMELAKGCAKLAKANAKYARFLRGENPTHKSIVDIVDNLYEEAADVIICLQELNLLDNDSVREWIEVKRERLNEHRKKVNVKISFEVEDEISD